MEIPLAWKQLDPAQLQGLILVVGGTDVGKSTLARYLHQRLEQAGMDPAYLDGDPGQSSLGPPTTMTVRLGDGRVRRWFVGDTTPRGHMLPMLVGAFRLSQAAGQGQDRPLIYDTCGLIDPTQGGVTLKMAKIDLLRPRLVIALQRSRELEPLLAPLRNSHRVRLLELPVAPEARPKDRLARQAYRRGQFARYFAEARELSLSWNRLAVFPRPFFLRHQLVALEDPQGFTRGLGIVLAVQREERQLRLWTPVPSLDGVDALRLGDLLLDPVTLEEQRVKRGTGG